MGSLWFAEDFEVGGVKFVLLLGPMESFALAWLAANWAGESLWFRLEPSGKNIILKCDQVPGNYSKSFEFVCVSAACAAAPSWGT